MYSKEELLKMKAGIFADSGVPRITKSESFASINEKIKNTDSHTVLVVDEENGKLIGLITDERIIEKLSEKDFAEKIQKGKVNAEHIMTPIDPDKTGFIAQSTNTLEDVIDKLKGIGLKKPFKVIPVVDESGAPIGQVTSQSIRKNLDELLETTR